MRRAKYRSGSASGGAREAAARVRCSSSATRSAPAVFEMHIVENIGVARDPVARDPGNARVGVDERNAKLGGEPAHVVVHDGQAAQVVRIVRPVTRDEVRSRLVDPAQGATDMGPAHEAFPAAERRRARARELRRRLSLGLLEERAASRGIGRDRATADFLDPTLRRLLATGPLQVRDDGHEDGSAARVARVLDHGAELSQVGVDPELHVLRSQERIGRRVGASPFAHPQRRGHARPEGPRESLETGVEARGAQHAVEAEGEPDAAADLRPVTFGVLLNEFVIAHIKDENVLQRSRTLRLAQFLQEVALDEVNLPGRDRGDAAIDDVHVAPARRLDPTLERARERAVLAVAVARDGALAEDEDARRARPGPSSREEAIDETSVRRPITRAVGGRAEKRRVDPPASRSATRRGPRCRRLPGLSPTLRRARTAGRGTPPRSRASCRPTAGASERRRPERWLSRRHSRRVCLSEPREKHLYNSR